MLWYFLKKVLIIGIVANFIAYNNVVIGIECNSSLTSPDQIGDDLPTFPEGT